VKLPFRPIPAALTALVAVLVLAPSAFGGKAASVLPTIQLKQNELNRSQPRLGEAVAFSVTYPREVKSPRIAVRCYGYDGAGYAEAGPYDAWFVLGGAGSDWQRAGGDATCTADLFYFTYKPDQEYHWLASTSFKSSG
jgi:hypothetical protein